MYCIAYNNMLLYYLRASGGPVRPPLPLPPRLGPALLYYNMI